MKIREKFEHALALCGYPPPRVSSSYRKIGAGAWHDAYLVTVEGRRLVVRLRKRVIYGRRESFDEKALHEDYAPVGLYYAQANRCRPGICPDEYHYHIQPDLSFTVETYLGPGLALPRLSPEQAHAYGRHVGAFLREMHRLPAPRPGFGDLVWNGAGLVGHDRRDLAGIWSGEADRLRMALDGLARSKLSFDWAAIRRKLESGLVERSFLAEPVTLVNGDVTPENFIARRARFAGLIDPVPVLNNGTRYAAFFVFCYRFLLPALADAPRYVRHGFDRHRPVMGAIAYGFEAGFVSPGDVDTRHQLRLECFFYLLRFAHRWWEILNSVPDEETYLRNGTPEQIEARLSWCLEELELYRLNAPWVYFTIGASQRP